MNISDYAASCIADRSRVTNAIREVLTEGYCPVGHERILAETVAGLMARMDCVGLPWPENGRYSAVVKMWLQFGRLKWNVSQCGPGYVFCPVGADNFERGDVVVFVMSVDGSATRLIQIVDSVDGDRVNFVTNGERNYP